MLKSTKHNLNNAANKAVKYSEFGASCCLSKNIQDIDYRNIFLIMHNKGDQLCVKSLFDGNYPAQPLLSFINSKEDSPELNYSDLKVLVMNKMQKVDSCHYSV